jgi:hypothetical protein
MQHDGVLEGVQVTFWEEGITSVVMEVYVTCDEGTELAHTSTHPASLLPPYEPEIQLDLTPTTFPIDPPIQVREGQTVEVVFHAPDAIKPTKPLVIAIDPFNSDANCRYVPDTPDGAGPNTNWDLRIDLLVH